MQGRRRLAWILPLIALAIGCAGGLAGVQSIPPTANPSEQIDALASELSSAQERDVDVLAPTWFGRARASLQAAINLRDRGEAVQSILQHVAEGRAELQQAESFAKVTASAVGPAIRARGDARSAGAARLAEYGAAEERFLSLGTAVEDNNLGSAKKREGEVTRMFRELELAAIKKNTMERITDLIAKARKDGAAEHAPTTLAATEKRHRELDSFITENRYAEEETAPRASELLFQANRLVHVTQEAKAASRRSPEETALAREELTAKLASSLALPDLRNQSADSQLRGIENAIAQLKQDRDLLANRVELLRSQEEQQLGRISLLEGQSEAERQRIARLEAERSFNARFAEVSAQFSPEEAEVYKKDQRLVIRLRSINFPVGSTVVLPESYPLMTKVQRAIRSFDQPRVIVEGHTDSTGSTDVNDRISQSRADAVKAYLVANNTVSPDRVTAVGKGFSEPLASDRTAEGRAQNRRIDVILDLMDPSLGPLPSVASPPPPQ